MKNARLFLLFLPVLFLNFRLPAAQAALGIDFLGMTSIAGTSSDTSGFTGNLEDGTPKNRFGAFGSAIAYTGIGNRYIATPDRGPADGATSYIDRYYEIDIAVSGGSVTASLLNTTPLSNGSGEYFTGFSGAFATGLRFDPEGVRMSYNHTLYISDEYGPFVREFNQNGEQIRELGVPDKFKISNPSATAGNELPPGNTSGRQANRGMEGLAISPDGTKLYGIMQNALIQDGALNASNQRRGFNNRILEIDLVTGETREFVYQLDARNLGVNELVALNDHEFLVLERDGDAGTNAAFKKIFIIDIAGATDVSLVPNLPQSAVLPPGVVPVSKTLFLDMLDPDFSLAGANFPEKIEGLAFGPDLDDGRRLLLITNDNDFSATNPSNIYAFAIDRDRLPTFQAQQFAAVPEPATLLLFTGALALSGSFRRRRS